MTNVNNLLHNPEVNEQLNPATEELITGDSDDPRKQSPHLTQ